jgi:hypothetical protein
MNRRRSAPLALLGIGADAQEIVMRTATRRYSNKKGKP